MAEAVKLGHQHETKAKDFVPKMYDALVKGEGLAPFDAADRIYKDLVGIWKKDTIRRLLPPESKNPVARNMQALSRFPSETKAGSTMRGSGNGGAGAAAPVIVDGAAAIADHESGEDDGDIVQLKKENALLRKAVEELESAKKSLLERTLKLEKLLAAQQRQQDPSASPMPRQNFRDEAAKTADAAASSTTTIVLPPHLFMKAYALMRGSTKPLVLRVTAREAVDIDRARESDI